MAIQAPLRIGYVPEHFACPLHYAKSHFGLVAELVPFPSGTGHMITSLRSGEIDVGIGLTEGWVAGLGREDVEGDGGYKIVGTYVETPLCWAISAGKDSNIKSIEDLRGLKTGVSRIGSGSYVMSFVLADQQGWLSSDSNSTSQSESQTGSSSPNPFTFVPLQTFAKLRDGVNDGTADFFMWEHFTSKKYHDSGEIKRVGEIYTPWRSWMIVASTAVLAEESSDGSSGSDETPSRLKNMFTKLDAGVKYFEEHEDESMQWISTELDYSEADAREWLKTVCFAGRTEGVDVAVIGETRTVLQKAGVLTDKAMAETQMVAQSEGAQAP